MLFDILLINKINKVVDNRVFLYNCTSTFFVDLRCEQIWV